jgi:hypothetical protein
MDDGSLVAKTGTTPCIVEKLEHIKAKIKFMNEAITQGPRDDGLNLFSELGCLGMYLFFNEIENNIEAVENEIRSREQ